MLTLKKVAITGAIASGKSTVCHFFEKLGAYVVSSDSLVHQLLNPNTQLGREIIDLLGADVVVEGVFHRSRIAQKVFHDPILLSALEACIHPRVQKLIETHYQRALQSASHSLFVVEIPLLYESQFEFFYDRVILVNADPLLCQQRFREGEEEYRRRARRFLPMEEKRKRADMIIENNSSLEELFQRVQTIFNSLLEGSV